MTANVNKTCGACLMLVPCPRGTRCVAPVPRRGMGRRRWLDPSTPCATCDRWVEQLTLPLFGGGSSE